MSTIEAPRKLTLVATNGTARQPASTAARRLREIIASRESNGCSAAAMRESREASDVRSNATFDAPRVLEAIKHVNPELAGLVDAFVGVEQDKLAILAARRNAAARHH